MIEERASVNREELEEYLQDCQDMATNLTGLLEAAEVLDNEGTCQNGVTEVLKVSGKIATNLTSKLDSVNLPR